MKLFKYILLFPVLNFILNYGYGQASLITYDTIDLAIVNGLIVDGSGSQPYNGNIYVAGDEIVYAGKENLSHPQIVRTIDANGRVVSPGFIDLHAHGNPLKTPDFENFLAMGVTTISLGQDGSSPAVNDIGEWLSEVQESDIGVNLAMFVGHGTLRQLSGVGMKAIPTPEEMDKMKALLKESLDHCFGLSTGLEYNPGLHAQEEELLDLAKVVGEKNRMIMSHMRNEDDDQLNASLQELIRQGAFCRVHVSHLKSVYGKGEKRAEEILRLLYGAREKGIDVTADLYPYTASYTGIGILFPEWAKTKEQFSLAMKLRKSELEEYLRKRVMKRNGPEATLLGSAPYTGKTLADLEKEMNKPFEKILVEDIGPQGSSGAYFVMDEVLQVRLLQDELISVCSDGSPTGYHPRGHGTFAKIIEKYVVEKNKLMLEKAIRKMTSYAADIMGIKDRGSLEAGKKADIIIFDPENVKARADYTDPFQLAEGFDIVIVNGKIARENGVKVVSNFGKVLKP